LYSSENGALSSVGRRVAEARLHVAGLVAGPDLAGGRPGPSGVFGNSERDWLLNYRVLKIEGFGGRLPVGGRPGVRGPPPLPKSGPDS